MEAVPVEEVVEEETTEEEVVEEETIPTGSVIEETTGDSVEGAIISILAYKNYIIAV